MDDKFLSSQFYTSHLAEKDAYNRFYDTVLIPRMQEELKDEGRVDFLGGLQVPSDDIARLVKDIFPPQELQGQVEQAIRGAVDYLNKEKDPSTDEVIQIPDFYVHFRPILGTRVPTPLGVAPVEGSAKPALLQFLREQLENNVVFLDPSEGDLSRKITVLAVQLDETLNQLTDPSFPIEAPSFESIPPDVRPLVYEQAVDLFERRGVPSEIVQGLKEVEEEVKEKLIQGDPKDAMLDALFVAIRPLVEPQIDKGFNMFRDDQLDSLDRFDPIARVAENRGESKTSFLNDLDTIRDWLARGKAMGLWLSILAVAVFSILLGLVHSPRVGSLLGWPGLTLFLSGIIFLGLGIFLRSQVPDRLESFLESRGSGCNAIAGEDTLYAPQFCQIALDVARSMATDAAGSYIGPSIVILLIGVFLISAAFAASRIHREMQKLGR